MTKKGEVIINEKWYNKKLFMVLAFVLLVFTAFQVRTSAFTEGVQAKYKTDFATYEESLAAAAEFNIEIAGESFVLLKNENQALPLGKSEAILVCLVLEATTSY